MAPKPRAQYEVRYAGRMTATLNIIPSMLLRAQNGDTKQRAALAHQYFKATGQRMPADWDWKRFRFRDLNKPGRPPRSRHSTTVVETAPQDDKRHCCDDDSCTMCDIGYHQRCRNGCTL